MSDPVRLTPMLTPETAVCRKSLSMCDTILPNTPLSGSEETENEVSPPQWPEKGDPWNEGDNDMDCELQQMAEEDEMIDLYNEETFGMDLDSEDTVTGGDSSRPLLQFGETPPVPPVPHISLPPTPRSLSPSPPKQHRPQYVPTCPAGQRGRGRGPRGQRGGQRKPQMFEDPAVMRTVEGRPSIKSLDSSIVECGTALSWSGWDENDWMSPSYRRTRKTSGSILQDNAIVYMIDGHDGRGHHPSSKFLVEPPYPFPSFRGRRGSPRRPYYNRSFAPRGTPQMNTVMPQSPLLSRQPLTPRQHYDQNQTGGFRFPLGRPCSPSHHSMAPKIMQLRFGTNSPRPSPVYSPSSNPVQRFSYPGPVTQLHPQHKRQIIQKFRTIQRKPERWDPYCDLMTAKEKEWIIRLQMIQLQSENPYREDYYYQEYYRRLEAKLAEEELGIRTKKELPKLTTPYITKPDTYTPVVHIEGSLGQVAVSTCYSPRRAIGAVHAAKVPHKVPNEEQKDTRQQRLDLLNKIEKLFIVLLEVEDAERVKTSVLTEAEETRQRENTQRKVKHIYSELKDPDTPELGEEFLPCLLISKGKKLLARLITFLDHDSTLLALRAVSSHLHTLMARDTDESLPVLFPPLRIVIGGLTFSQLVGVLKILTISESLTTYECLTLACQNKFGLSLLYALLSQGERLLSSGAPLEPSIGDFETWTDTIFQVAGQLSQCSLVEPLFMPPNLLTLFCRYLDKRTVHQLKSNIESATGFLALAS